MHHHMEKHNLSMQTKGTWSQGSLESWRRRRGTARACVKAMQLIARTCVGNGRVRNLSDLSYNISKRRLCQQIPAPKNPVHEHLLITHRPHFSLRGSMSTNDLRKNSKYSSVTPGYRASNSAYPYPFFLRETTKFSPRFMSHRLVSPIRLLVLGRTYGTYLHYECSYV